MDTTLAAATRSNTGKGNARTLRRSGKLPAVMYGPNSAPTPLAVDPDALQLVFKKTGDRNTVVQLEIDGKKHPVLVREVQRHPVTRKLVHVDFYKVAADRKIESMVRLNPIGKPAGALLGGRLVVIRRSLTVRSTYDKIPATFDIDVSAMEIGDYLRVSEIEAPEGVEILFDTDFNVLACRGKAAALVIEEPEDGEEGEETEGEGEGEGEGAEASEEASD